MKILVFENINFIRIINFFYVLSDFLILSEVFGLSDFFVFADFFCSLESEQFYGYPECTNLLSCAMIDYYKFFTGLLFFHR